MIVKIIKVMMADRQAGWGYVARPPESWIGRIGMITRPLINWNGYWIVFYVKKGEKIYEKKELFHKDECIEATKKEIKEFNKLQIEYTEQKDAKMVAERL
jgi:hypothetical protein